MIVTLAIRTGFDSWAVGWIRASELLGAIRDLPPGLAGNLMPFRILGWSGWFLWPSGMILLALALQVSAGLSRLQRALIAAISIRLQVIILTLAVSGLFVAGLQNVWIYAPGDLERYWGGPSADTAAAFSAAAALGAIWPRTRKFVWVYAILVGMSQIALAGVSPSQVLAGGAIGILISFLVRGWFAARQLGFFVDAQGHLARLPGPSWRRISSLPVRLLGEIESPQLPAVQKSLAVAGLALTSWGLVGLFHADYIVAQAAQQNPAGNFENILTALRGNFYHLRSEDDLLPLDESRNFGEWILWSRRYCELLQGERVVMRPTLHPVCVKDASFYWYGGEDILRMKREGVRFNPQPPYSLDADLLRTKPALMDAAFLSLNADTDILAPMLQRDYVQARHVDGKAWLFVRRDWLLNNIANTGVGGDATDGGVHR